MSNEYKDWLNDLTEEQKYNVEMCQKYPILIPTNRFTGEEVENYDYTWTELDAMPEGWRRAFGIEMIAELQEVVNNQKEKDTFRILDIKEKYGSLRFYCSWYTDEINKIILKYEELSIRTCVNCGKPATRVTTGWISPYCNDCAKYVGNNMPIEDFYGKLEEYDN